MIPLMRIQHPWHQLLGLWQENMNARVRQSSKKCDDNTSTNLISISTFSVSSCQAWLMMEDEYPRGLSGFKLLLKRNYLATSRLLSLLAISNDLTIGWQKLNPLSPPNALFWHNKVRSLAIKTIWHLPVKQLQQQMTSTTQHKAALT